MYHSQRHTQYTSVYIASSGSLRTDLPITASLQLYRARLMFWFNTKSLSCLSISSPLTFDRCSPTTSCINVNLLCVSLVLSCTQLCQFLHLWEFICVITIKAMTLCLLQTHPQSWGYALGGQDILTFGMRALVLSGQDPLVTTWLHEGETVPFNKG